jgi:hypothetical protein
MTLISDNSLTMSWATRLASQRSLVTEHLVQALALCLKIMHACQLTPMHIEGKPNAIANVPSWLFGSNPVWMCMSNFELLTMFNTLFPLPTQQSWTVYRPNCMGVTHMTSTMQMKPFVLEDWRRLPIQGGCIG